MNMLLISQGKQIKSLTEGIVSLSEGCVNLSAYSTLRASCFQKEGLLCLNA